MDRNSLTSDQFTWLVSEFVNADQQFESVIAAEHQIETQKANEESKMKQRNADVFQEASKILAQK